MMRAFRQWYTLSLAERLSAFAITSVFFLYNLRFHGPTYLKDEIGYLTKAALLSGNVVDGASSYFGGYSLFIAPAFMLLHSPHAVWIGILATNALLWGGSFLLLGRVLTLWAAHLSTTDRWIALAMTAAYPAWLVMSGYAFPTSAMAFVFLFSLLELAKSPDRPLGVITHSISVGFIYWIHPTGLGVAVASTIALGLLCYREKKYTTFIVHIVIIVALIFAYKKIVHPLWNNAMTPLGYINYGHYPSIPSVMKKFATTHFWLSLLGMISGQLSYLFVSSFGLVAFGIAGCCSLAYRFNRPTAVEVERRLNTAAVFLSLSVILVVGIGATLFSSTDLPPRTDYWIYGRYSDAIAPPLIACGIVVLIRMRWRRRLAVLCATVAFTTVSGWLVDWLGGSTHTSNIVNVPAFWPQYVLASDTFQPWMLLGCAGMAAATLLGRWGPSLMIGGLFLSASAQEQWHTSLLSVYSKPSSLMEFVRRNYVRGTCVAFDDKMPDEPKSSLESIGENVVLYDENKYIYGLSLYQLERFPLYEFYLFDYRYRRMSEAEWQNDCNGPLLTFSPERALKIEGTRLIGRDTSAGLYIAVKSADDHQYIGIPASGMRGDMAYARSDRGRDLISWDFTMNAEDLARTSIVGTLDNDSLKSRNTAGFLFYGPYRLLPKGRYSILIHGQFKTTQDTVVDVTSASTKSTYAEHALGAHTSGLDHVTIDFELPGSVPDLEIRLRVGGNDQVAVSGYEVTTKAPEVGKLAK